jgi:hypothetical protein
LLSIGIVDRASRHPHGKRRSRRSSRRRNLRVVAWMLACGAAALFLMLAVGRQIGEADRARIEAADASAAAVDDSDIDAPVVDDHDLTAGRPVYRYSVIPGGAYTPRELEDAMNRDPVVAEAYRSVAAAGVHAEVVAADTQAYMSYRVGDGIYWTKHPIRLRRGETILTDGATELRGRCGNGISFDPMLPTADSEPTPMELEALVAPTPPVVGSRPLAFDFLAQGGIPWSFSPNGLSAAGSTPGGLVGAIQPAAVGGTPPAGEGVSPLDVAPPPDASVDVPGAPSLPPGTPSLPPGTPSLTPSVPGFELASGPSGGDGTPIVLVTIPGGLDTSTIDGFGDGGTHTGTPSSPTPDGPAAPVPTPEPGTMLLIGGGLAGMIARRLRSRR